MTIADTAERRPRIAVYCASRLGHDPAFAEVAHEIGVALAARGADLVFGGGSIGLMGVVADAALDGGSNVIGVITEQLLDREVAHQGISQLRVVPDMPARKQVMFAEADAFCTLPGGIGTMEEFFEVLTWGYLGIHPKPMALVNVNGYYDTLLDFIGHAIEEGLLKPEVLKLLVLGEDASVIESLLEVDALPSSSKGHRQ